MDIQIVRLVNRLNERGFSVELTKVTKLFLVESGYDPAYGARPLKRAVRQYIEDQLAPGGFSEGDRIVIDQDEEGLVFGK